MKKFTFFLTLALFSIQSFSQNWLWSKPIGVNNVAWNSAQRIQLGLSGNVFTYFSDYYSTYLIKCDADGDTLWKRYFDKLKVNDICFDSLENIYFAGTFTATCHINSVSFTSNGITDAIVGILDKNGNLIKARSFGGSTTEKANSITISNNNIILIGLFCDTLRVDSVALNRHNAHGETYILKMDPNLKALKGTYTSSDGCEGMKLAADKNDSIYLLGNSSYTLGIGTHSLYIAEDGQFLAKFDSDLNVLRFISLAQSWYYGFYNPCIYFDRANNIILTYHQNSLGSNVKKLNPIGYGIWDTEIEINDNYVVSIDPQYNIWAVGRFQNGNGPISFSVFKIDTAGHSTAIIQDQSVRHIPLGVAAKDENDFYLIGTCDTASSLNGYSCSPEGSIFLARYSLLAGMKENKLNAELFRIYPNPSDRTLTVELNNSDNQIYNLTIKNPLGQIIYGESIKTSSENFKEINLPEIACGVYIVELQNKSQNVRAVKQLVIR